MPDAHTQLVADVERRTDELVARLRRARITGKAAGGAVVAAVDGYGNEVTVHITAGTVRRYAADELAEHLTTALRAAEQAAATLRAREFAAIRIGDETVASLRAYPADAADAVARAFQIIR